MRKGTEGFAIESIIRMVFSLIILMVGISMLTIVASGKGNEIVDKARATINEFSQCHTLEPKTYNEFMAEMQKIYQDCKNSPGNTCETRCKTMTINLPDGIEAYKIGGGQIGQYVSENFNQIVLGARIYCGDGLFSDNADRIRVFNNYGNNEPFCKDYNTQVLVWETYFEIAKGSKVTISAEKKEWLFGNFVELKLKITGGDANSYKTAVIAPWLDNCVDDSSCINPSKNGNVWCAPVQNDQTKKACTYIGYCRHMCETVGGGTCPANSRCNKLVATCSETGCVPEGSSTSVTSPTMVCPGPPPISAVMTNIADADESFTAKWVIVFETTPKLEPGTIMSVPVDGEQFYKMSSRNRLTSAGDITGKDVKMSIMLGAYDTAGGKTTIYQGCY